MWIFALFSYVGIAQSNIDVDYKNTPLKEVLKDVEAKSDVLFSYNEAAIAGKSITITKSQMSLTELIKILQRQSGLLFEQLSEQQIIVKDPSTKITICGYLFDQVSNDALPYADVYVDGSSKGVTSDENGYFTMENVQSTSDIIIQYLGYRSLNIKASNLKNDTCQNLFLDPSPEALEGVIIQAYITKGLDKNNDGSTVVSNQDLGILPGQTEPDVFQSLQLIPGINSLNESASDIQIRGGSSDQNLIFFDDIKLYNTAHFFGIISSINPYVVEETKVYKSGASPEYGDRVSGVIDISTADKVQDSTQFGLGVNGTHGDVFVKSPISKSVGIVASARRSYTDLFETPTYEALANKVFQNTKLVTNTLGQVVEDDEEADTDNDNTFYFYDASVKLIFEPSDHDLITVSGLITRNDLDFSSQDDEDIIQDRLDVKNQGASISWQGKTSSKIDHSVKLYYSNFDSFYNNSLREGLEIQEENLRKNTVEEYGIDLNFNYEFSPKHNAKIGYQYTNTDVFFQLFRDELDENVNDPDEEDEDGEIGDTRDFNRFRDNTNKTHSIYGEYIYTPKQNSFISLGLRLSDYSIVDELLFEPRLNIEYPLSSTLRLKATAEKRYQTISELVEFEDTQLRLENQIWTLSNEDDDIPVLESTQFSAGLIFSYKGFVLDIDAYVKKIQGLTSFTNGFTNAVSDFSIGESDIYGVDLLLKKKINDFNFWLGYTFNDVNYSFKEIQASAFPGNNDITHNFRLSASYQLSHWEFSLGWNYRTGSPFTPVDDFDPQTETIDFGNINSERLPDYHRLDASLLYNFNFSKSKRTKGVLGLSLQNIYSRQVPLSVFYRVDTDPVTDVDELNRIEQLSLGFTPNITFRLYF